MNERTNNGDPDLLTSAGRELTQRPGGVVDGLKRREATFLKEAGMEDDREDACSSGLRRIQETWQLEGGDKRGGEKVSADEKNGELGHCQCRGYFAFPK